MIIIDGIFDVLKNVLINAISDGLQYRTELTTLHRTLVNLEEIVADSGLYDRDALELMMLIGKAEKLILKVVRTKRYQMYHRPQQCIELRNMNKELKEMYGWMEIRRDSRLRSRRFVRNSRATRKFKTRIDARTSRCSIEADEEFYSADSAFTSSDDNIDGDAFKHPPKHLLFTKIKASAQEILAAENSVFGLDTVIEPRYYRHLIDTVIDQFEEFKHDCYDSQVKANAERRLFDE